MPLHLLYRKVVMVRCLIFNAFKAFSLVLLVLLFGCGEEPVQRSSNQTDLTLELVASSEDQWTGVARSSDGRMFVNFPRWSDDLDQSVGEIVDGEVIPYPNSSWNTYSGTADDRTFVCVQSVFVDNSDRLWVLDPANPFMEGVVDRGPRLYQFDVATDSLSRIYSFPDSLIESDVYLNDVRIDQKHNMAYLSDSGRGGIYVLDLESGETQLRLEEHFSTKAETDKLDINGYTWQGQIHSDGIALSNESDYLYYAALSGHSLYRVPVEDLINPSLSERELGDEVTEAQEIIATDGMLFGPTNTLYLGGLEENAIYVWKEDNPYHKLIEDERIKWADSFTSGDDGSIYFTTSQIHIPSEDRSAYHLYRIAQ